MNTAVKTKTASINKRSSDAEFHSVRRALLDQRLSLDEGASLLFSLGYKMDRARATDLADEYYSAAIEFLEFLTRRDDSDAAVIRFARSAQRHGMMLIGLGRINMARAAFRRSVELFDSVIARGVSAPAMEELARSISWLASSQCLCGDFHLAERSYLRASALWRNLARFTAESPKKLEYQRFLRLAHLGLQECANNARPAPSGPTMQ